MDLTTLTVYECPFPKQRIGKENDGGYVVAMVPDISYKLLVAGGVCDDVSFEEHFISLYPESIGYAYDGTVGEPPALQTPRLQFVHQNIGARNVGQSTTNLHSLLESHEDVFVKMDIEGHEIAWFLSLDTVHMNKMLQMVVEFHFPFSLLETIVFDKINRTHYLVHLHANNNCGTRVVDGVMVPNVFECTFLHKKFFGGSPFKNRQPIPSALDMPNVAEKDEIRLTTPPFVHP